jgi:transmembrane sensor
LTRKNLNTIPDHIDQLISKFLAGEASPEEALQVKVWADESEGNRKYLQQFETIFERAASMKEWQRFDVDAAWHKMKSRVPESDPKIISMHKPRDTFFFLKIAAGIIAILGAGFFAYKLSFNGTSLKPVAVTTSHETLNDTLPDGSKVFLNKETKLDYSFDKKESVHRVKLQGEAYFHIKHEDDKKFLVEANGIYVRDIGTAFNVTAYPESNTVEVVVETGEVHFFTDENPGIYLKAGGKGIYNKKDKTFAIDEPEGNVLAYKTKFFSFSNAELGSVVEALNEVYDKKIIIGEHLKSCPLTVSFNNEEISEIALIISETLGLKVKEDDRGILLEGEGCE